MILPEASFPHLPPPPFDASAVGGAFPGEDLWIDVIRQMDTVYADLVRSQTALEDQNRELAEAHDFIGSVLDAMTDIVIACDDHGTIERVNGALVRIAGGREDDWRGRPITALFAAQDLDGIKAGMVAARAGDSVDQREWHILAEGGGLATVSTNLAARRDGDGRPAGLVMVGRPLGELQRAYRELDEAHRTLTRTQQQLLTSEKMAALGRLVAGVAHELNNPISFVFGNMYALKRYGAAITRYLGALGPEGDDPTVTALRQELRIDRILADLGPLVDGTLEGAERVRDIVQDLRRFSSNQRELPEQFDLLPLLQTAADWVAKARRDPPEIVFDLPNLLEVTSRKGQLHQILVNLVQNACDAVAARPDGRVRIRAALVDGLARVEVIDNGHGVLPEHRDKLFEPFFTTKPVGSGTGLGLYVSYTMAAKLGGQLTLSEGEDGGACFTLTVPPIAGDEP